MSWRSPGARETWEHLAGRCFEGPQKDRSGCLILVGLLLPFELGPQMGHLTKVGAVLDTEAGWCSEGQVMLSSVGRILRLLPGVLPILA